MDLEERIEALEKRVDELEAQVRQLCSWQDLESEINRKQEYFLDD